MKKHVPTLCVLLSLWLVSAGLAGDYFADIPGYRTLICDFHMHTVFSDGLVWPSVRVDEAEREGIDVISITDHIEYQPHVEHIPTNHNEPYALVQERAKEKNILLIKGTEITRETPPGHYNALFLNDIDLLETAKFLDVIEAADEQDGFVFWNHHTWKGRERGEWKEVQTEMYENKWLHGMEVANGGTYYPLAHQWCLEKNMTMVGNSDIHRPSIEYRYTPEEHRTLTLVFVRARTVAAVKEALERGRTAVWYENSVIGREAYLRPLFESSVTVAAPHYINKRGTAFVEIRNNSLMDIQLKRTGQTGPGAIEVPADGKTIVRVQLEDGQAVRLKYVAENYLIRPETGLPVEFTVAAEEAQSESF